MDPGELHTPQSSSDSTVRETEVVLEVRMKGLESYLLTNFPRNISDREKLIECGYSALLWEKVRESLLGIFCSTWYTAL